MPTTLTTLPKSHTEFQYVDQKMQNTIRPHVAGNIRAYDVLKVEKIDNIEHWRRYARKKKQIEQENGGEANERWLFHGTNHADKILHNGFDVRKANPSGMFGPGLYFARDSSKSNQYVFEGFAGGCTKHGDSLCTVCERKMFLSRVCMGKVKEEISAVNRSNPPPGYHSVKGVVGPYLKYSEFIVYNNDQVCLRYLATYKVIV